MEMQTLFDASVFDGLTDDEKLELSTCANYLLRGGKVHLFFVRHKKDLKDYKIDDIVCSLLGYGRIDKIYSEGDKIYSFGVRSGNETYILLPIGNGKFFRPLCHYDMS